MPSFEAVLVLLSRFRIWISIRIADWLRIDAGIGGGSDPPALQ